ncbi:TPA: N-acetyltransferase family protein [Klebsiella pneumoniae]
MRIRSATENDIGFIAEIYNEAILNSTSLWVDQIIDVPNLTKWINERQGLGYPVIVAVDEQDAVMGYASYGEWRAFDGYRYTVEHSVYVRHDFRGKGIGKALMLELISLALEQNKHVMVTGIESENHASIALHKQLGFSECGTLPEVGTKFGRWLNLTFLQLRISNWEHP